MAADTITLIMPVADAYVSGKFKELYDLGDGLYEHPGVDLLRNAPAQTEGSPVVACATGKVTVHRPDDGWGNGTFGVCVVLDHPETPFWTIVAHLKDEPLSVKTGDMVAQGQPIGRIGMTGKTTGAHCHWGMSRSDGGAFDPARFKDMDGVNRIGNKNLLDPTAYLAASTPTDAVALAQSAAAKAESARAEVLELNRALMLRMSINAIAFGELNIVEQAASALRKGGFKL